MTMRTWTSGLVVALLPLAGCDTSPAQTSREFIDCGWAIVHAGRSYTGASRAHRLPRSRLGEVVRGYEPGCGDDTRTRFKLRRINGIPTRQALAPGDPNLDRLIFVRADPESWNPQPFSRELRRFVSR